MLISKYILNLIFTLDYGNWSFCAPRLGRPNATLDGAQPHLLLVAVPHLLMDLIEVVLTTVGTRCSMGLALGVGPARVVVRYVHAKPISS